MAQIKVNGVSLYYELHGAGEPLVLVHGSWADETQWASVAPGLAESFRVLVYDRRGHSRSERPDSQGSLDEDGDDLATLLEALDLAPAHVVTSSLTEGSESPPVFARVLDRLVQLIPHVRRAPIEGAAHTHLMAPERYVEVTTRMVQHAAA